MSVGKQQIYTSSVLDSLPSRLQDFRNFHEGESIVVAGCGTSLRNLVAPERFVTIGVNDVGRLFQPDYLVVLNPRHQFAPGRFAYVEQSQSRAIFTQLSLDLPHPHVVPIRLGRRGGVDTSDPNVLHYTRNSPYVALCLALHMGARRVGLVGVDFTNDHFFAQTGRHSLTSDFEKIDHEYRRLADECKRVGVEVVNLSAESRLTAFPKMSPERFAAETFVAPSTASLVKGRRVFFVHYRFITCGEVFRDGLMHAGDDLGIEHDGAHWDDPNLREKIERFSPDLLFVVHGRKFSRRWSRQFAAFNSAVWLLDEPYEVDDTARFSSQFRTVFVNDSQSLSRHANAHYLPVCYDPWSCSYVAGQDRPYQVGFVGSTNPARERMLGRLARAGLLSYVVGGPWRDSALRSLNLADNAPADQIPDLYRRTSVALNVFRTKHHFNRAGLTGFSLTPRVYEASACGATVLSEPRPELFQLWPDAPSFADEDELEAQTRRLLGDGPDATHARRSGIRAYREHTYAARLAKAVVTALDLGETDRPAAPARLAAATRPEPPAVPRATKPATSAPPSSQWIWPDAGARSDGDLVVLEKLLDPTNGSESGLVGALPFADVLLEFDLSLDPGACFLAKIHQQSADDQHSNSYHLVVADGRAYYARHNHVFRSFLWPHAEWSSVALAYSRSTLSLIVDGVVRCSVRDVTLPSGFCFLGVRGGRARLRNLRVRSLDSDHLPIRRTSPNHAILRPSTLESAPLLSIVTTVYDRIECLEKCLRSVDGLSWRDFEHIVVADRPPEHALEQIEALVDQYARPNRSLAVLTTRQNDWGIGPAAAGLAMATGKYLAFLSDDNGYLPGHFEPLLDMLETRPNLGFVYSSCLYDGRFVLRRSTPRFGGIDLGQPVFRTESFDLHLGGTLPFAESAWDWRMIDRLMRSGVTWKHLDRATFVFRLAQYPDLIAALP